MTVHHLVTEKDCRIQCFYCGNNLSSEKWSSDFDFHRHYKTVMCSCGNEHRMRVDFDGNGIDDWNGKDHLLSTLKKMGNGKSLEKNVATYYKLLDKHLSKG